MPIFWKKTSISDFPIWYPDHCSYLHAVCNFNICIKFTQKGGYIIWRIQYDWLGTLSKTNWLAGTLALPRIPHSQGFILEPHEVDVQSLQFQLISPVGCNCSSKSHNLLDTRLFFKSQGWCLVSKEKEIRKFVRFEHLNWLFLTQAGMYRLSTIRLQKWLVVLQCFVAFFSISISCGSRWHLINLSDHFRMKFLIHRPFEGGC